MHWFKVDHFKEFKYFSEVSIDLSVQFDIQILLNLRLQGFNSLRFKLMFIIIHRFTYYPAHFNTYFILKRKVIHDRHLAVIIGITSVRIRNLKTHVTNYIRRISNSYRHPDSKQLEFEFVVPKEILLPECNCD